MNTNCKSVREAMKSHVISFFEADNDNAIVALCDQAKSMIYRNLPTLYKVGVHMAEGGSFLIYHQEVKDYLNSLGINPLNKEFSDVESWALYCHLCGLAVERVCADYERKV